MQDHTAQQWLSAFEEQGSQILGMTGQEHHALEGTADADLALSVSPPLSHYGPHIPISLLQIVPSLSVGPPLRTIGVYISPFC